MKPETAELYYKSGSSDKVYTTSLEQSGISWMVKFEYGRRGSALITGTKIQNVLYHQAKKVYDKLVSEKRGKGYEFMNGGASKPKTITVGSGTDTGWKPQLLNEIEESEVESYLKNPEFCAQEKFDGRNRLLLRVTSSVSIGANRKGLEVPITAEAAKEVSKLPKGTVLAGEDLGSTIPCFDVISEKTLGYGERLKVLDTLIPKGPYIQKVYTAFTEKEKRALFAKLKKENGEGIVFKNLVAHYTPGRPASGGAQLKFKFTATASVIAGPVNKGKRSVSMYILDNGVQTDIGNVTVYPNQSIPKPGDILEVKYLYAYKDGSLFQPVLLSFRDDIDESACDIKQLKYKKEEE